MKREIWVCLVIILMGAVATGLALGMAGCGGGQPAASDAGESSVEAAPPEEAAVPEAVEEPAPEPEPAEEAPAVETDATEAGETEPEAAAPSTEPEGPASLLEWERQGGSAGHCDRMTIFPDGSVIAVLCLNGIDRGTVETTLSADQADQLNAWADRFASFSRRESDIAGAAMRTVMEGRGEAVPTTEEKTAVAKFAKDLFLALTTPPE
jgi:hypothetical protein